MLFNALALISLLPISTAHFTLTWPTARGFDDSKAGNFPCGGFDSVKTPRTEWPINGGPVQLRMQHTQTNVEVLLAIGDDPGDNYNVVLRPTLSQEGLGNFCIGQLNVPEGVNVSDGTPATLQVVSNGDPEGGLYQCADITLTSKTLSENDYNSHCNNNTGIKVTAENLQGNPNGTVQENPAPAPSESGPSPTNGGAVPSPSQPGLASHHSIATWLMGVIGIAAFALL